MPLSIKPIALLIALLLVASTICNEGKLKKDTINKQHLYVISNTLTNTEICSEPAFAGPCRALHARWYFNGKTKSCDKFLFGGWLVRKATNQMNQITKSSCAKSFAFSSLQPSKQQQFQVKGRMPGDLQAGDGRAVCPRKGDRAVQGRLPAVLVQRHQQPV